MSVLIFVNRTPYEVNDFVFPREIRDLIGAPEEWPVIIKGMPGEEDTRMLDHEEYFMEEMAELLCHPEECW